MLGKEKNHIDFGKKNKRGKKTGEVAAVDDVLSLRKKKVEKKKKGRQLAYDREHNNTREKREEKIRKSFAVWVLDRKRMKELRGKPKKLPEAALRAHKSKNAKRKENMS